MITIAQAVQTAEISSSNGQLYVDISDYVSVLLTTILIILYWKIYHSQEKMADIQETHAEIMSSQTDLMTEQTEIMDGQEDVMKEQTNLLDKQTEILSFPHLPDLLIESPEFSGDSIELTISNQGGSRATRLNLDCYVIWGHELNKHYPDEMRHDRFSMGLMNRDDESPQPVAATTIGDSIEANEKNVQFSASGKWRKIDLPSNYHVSTSDPEEVSFDGFSDVLDRLVWENDGYVESVTIYLRYANSFDGPFAEPHEIIQSELYPSMNDVESLEDLFE